MMALTRAVSPSIGRCQLSHLPRQPIDPAVAASQHARYTALLESFGCRVTEVPAAPELPDSVFVEDTAVVLDEVAIVGRSSVASRRSETEPVASELGRHRPIRRIHAPGTLEGGDVLRTGRTIWVGESRRTSAAGLAQLRSIAEPLGYEVRPVRVTGCLHLKTAVTAVADDALLVSPDWVDVAPFQGLHLTEVHPDEPFAANVLRLGTRLIMDSGHPRTVARLRSAGRDVTTVDISELAKAEGGVTCCSLLLSDTIAFRPESHHRPDSGVSSRGASG